MLRLAILIGSACLCPVQAKPSPVAQMATLALASPQNAAGCTEAGLAVLEAGMEQQQQGVPSEQRRLAVEQRLAGNTGQRLAGTAALVEAEEALEQGRIGLASARLLVARYPIHDISSISVLSVCTPFLHIFIFC